MAHTFHTGIIVGEGETSRFLEDIHADIALHHHVNLFKVRRYQWPFFHERLNRLVLQYDLRTFLANQDVTIFEWASALLATATRLPKTRPIVTRLHRYEMFEWVERINWSAVDKIILVSQAMQRKFISRFPEHAQKTIVIPEAISTARYKPVQKAFRGDIGILCNLIPRKRVYELILMFYELAQKRGGLHLHIGGDKVIGSEDYYDALQTLIRKLNLEADVTFYGEVTDASNWYHNIDIFVSNSYSEGLQISPMEAMASGCYCLSHHWDGAEELLPEEYLFYTGTQLQQKILAYCDASDSERRVAQADLRAIACDRFEVQQIAAKLRDTIEEVAFASKRKRIDEGTIKQTSALIR